MKILLVRHGESRANDKKSIAGQADIPLSERGKLQAKRLAEYLFERYNIDEIYSSDLSRAKKTALPVSALTGKKIILRKDLREIDAGEWQGRTYEEIAEVFPETYGVWQKNIGFAVCDGGESVKELSERAFGALKDIAENAQGDTVAVFTHATPIRCLVNKLKGNDLSGLKGVGWVSNASVTAVSCSCGAFILDSVGNDEFLGDIKTEFPTRA